MTIHYHGTPITPRSVLETLAGHHFCISFAAPHDVKRCHEIGQGVMLDNGAFSIWKSGKGELDPKAFWAWAEPWLDCPTTWAVIPDHIEADWKENAALISGTPKELASNPHKVAPVWHLHDPIERLCELADWWPRICFGSSDDFSVVGSQAWHNRVGDAFEALYRSGHKYTMIHMLRGMKCVRMGCYPFYSVDSTDVARNHHLGASLSHAKLMASEWDGVQCPVRLVPAPSELPLF